MTSNPLTTQRLNATETVTRTAIEMGVCRKHYSWPLKNRIAWLKELDRLIKEDYRDKICQVVATEKGVSEFNVLQNEYAPARWIVRECAKQAPRVLADEDRSSPLSINFGNKRRVIRKEPFGIVGVISPFNYPFVLPLGPVVAALATGNSVILKPSAETQLTNALLEEIIKRSLEKFRMANAFHVLPPGQEYGEELVLCNQVNKIHFTGSVAAGLKVCQANDTVRFFVPAALELGGSNAAIVLADADLREAARVIVWARFNGLSCNAIKRVFVEKSVYPDLCKMLRKMIDELRMDEIVSRFSARERKNFEDFLADYYDKKESLQLRKELTFMPTGPKLLEIGEYDSALKVLNEETFVPILPVVSVRDAKEAILRANQTGFGLGASVFTRDPLKFWNLAAQLDCGGVYHNDALTEFAQAQLPFGGRKNSGWGYTHGREGLMDFVQLKTVIEEKKRLRDIPVRWLLQLVFGENSLKLQLYPWTDQKMKFIRRWIDWIIELS